MKACLGDIASYQHQHRKIESIDALLHMKHSLTVLKLCQKKDDDDDEVKFNYLAICQFTTSSILSGNNIYTDYLKSSKTTYGWFWKIRSAFIVMITLHCIVWVAILFPGHPRVLPHYLISKLLQSIENNSTASATMQPMRARRRIHPKK